MLEIKNKQHMALFLHDTLFFVIKPEQEKLITDDKLMTACCFPNCPKLTTYSYNRQDSSFVVHVN